MKHYIGPANPMHVQFDALASYQAQHFAYAFESGVATLTLDRPERKNPLTFESYAELRNLFRALMQATCFARSAAPPTSRWLCSPVPAATFVQAATCTKSSARSPK